VSAQAGRLRDSRQDAGATVITVIRSMDFWDREGRERSYFLMNREWKIPEDRRNRFPVRFRRSEGPSFPPVAEGLPSRDLANDEPSGMAVSAFIGVVMMHLFSFHKKLALTFGGQSVGAGEKLFVIRNAKHSCA